jgi:lipoyl-dependent peroxiredoxin
MIKKAATAEWSGNLESGSGSFSFGHEPGISETYTKESRFEEGKGVGPEDLIAAAHAGCYSMALSDLLTEEAEAPQRVMTSATVSLGEDSDGFSIATSKLKTNVLCPGLTKEKLQKLASAAAENCPVSKALVGVEISVDAVLMDSRGEPGK